MLSTSLFCLLLSHARTPTAGMDYYGFSFGISFQPGDDEVCIDIDIIDDGDPEPNEVFEVTYTFVDIPAPPSIATVTIIDNDQSMNILSFGMRIRILYLLFFINRGGYHGE